MGYLELEIIVMEIKKGATFLMFKINTPNGIDFLKEHKKILDANGEVWLCRFGKTNVVLSKITADGNYVFVKDSAKNDNRIYIGTVSSISKTQPLNNYPTYYDQINLARPLWFNLSDLCEVRSDFVMKNFRTKSSNASLEGVFRSMCNSFYIECISNVIL